MKTLGIVLEGQIEKAIKALKQKYGVVGLDNKYLIAKDIDGDMRIAPFGLLDKILWEAGAINANNFIKIKDLI